MSDSDRLPVICEKVEQSKVPDLDRNKFIVRSDLSVGQLVMTVRERVDLPAESAIFLFVNEAVPNNDATMGELYRQCRDEDGFLYVKYSGENTFG